MSPRRRTLRFGSQCFTPFRQAKALASANVSSITVEHSLCIVRMFGPQARAAPPALLSDLKRHLSIALSLQALKPRGVVTSPICNLQPLKPPESQYRVQPASMNLDC